MHHQKNPQKQLYHGIYLLQIINKYIYENVVHPFVDMIEITCSSKLNKKKIFVTYPHIPINV